MKFIYKLRKPIIGVIILSAILLISFFFQPSSEAVPSFARQTGMSCSTCHMAFPQLTKFGRAFKLNGYTLSTMESVEAKSDSGNTILKIMKFLPLSAMVQTSFTHMDKNINGTANDNFSFPQQLSFLLAGEVTPQIGLFLQITYNDIDNAFAWDNTDIRYSNSTTLFSDDLIWGLTLNNNPTVQDLWNTTSAWGYPFASSPIAPTPGAAPLVSGALAQNVIGLGAYSLWNDLLYTEISFYRSSFQGGAHPPDSTVSLYIKGLAPYWRLALQKSWTDNYLSIGTFGMMANTIPAGISGDADKYTDIGLDLQYEMQLGNDWLTAYTSYVHENQDLKSTYAAGNAENSTNTLNAFKFNLNYLISLQYDFSLGYFNTTGSSDNKIYSPAELTGYYAGKPNSDGFIGEISYLPWLNTKFSLQYVYYSHFNGASANYDGSGRSALSNNALYLLGWIMF